MTIRRTIAAAVTTGVVFTVFLAFSYAQVATPNVKQSDKVLFGQAMTAMQKSEYVAARTPARNPHQEPSRFGLCASCEALHSRCVVRGRRFQASRGGISGLHYIFPGPVRGGASPIEDRFYPQKSKKLR
jgi:hypothetical protein